MATYDGVALFGGSVRCRMELSPSAAQVNEFFGISGQQSLYGGGRGRIFLISGVLAGTNASVLAGVIGLLTSYDDGIGRVLVDSLGTAWPSVVFRRFIPAERILPFGTGFCLPYKAQFDGLI